MESLDSNSFSILQLPRS